MIRYQFFSVLLVSFLLSNSWADLVSAQAVDTELAQKQLGIDTKTESILEELLESNAGARQLFEQAAGYAAFSVTKAGFFVTAGGGTGVLVDKATGRRIYMRMGTGGIGIAIGAQTYDLVVFFENQPILEAFMDGGWDTSANAQAAAGQVGYTATSSFVDGVAFFQLTGKGLMAVADVASTRFWIAKNLN
jgi:lipid-binding SYLF domain-containing protein